MLRIYLAGPINGCTDDECRPWRETLASQLADVATCLDPMRRDYRGREDESVDAIVHGDLDDIDASDVVVVNAARPSWGTAMEVRYAWTQGTPVVVWMPADQPVSPWLRYHSAAILHDLDAVVAWLRKAA